MGQEVPVHSVVFFGVADQRFDGCAAFELALDGVGQPAFLSLRVNLELVFLRGVMAPVSGVGEDAGEGRAGYRFDAGKDGFQRMPVIGVSRKRLGMEMNWPPFDEATVVARLTLTPNS